MEESDPQASPQFELQRRHFAVVALMVKSAQVQNAVQNQPADLVFRAVPFGAGVAPRRLGRNNNVAQKTSEIWNLES